MLAWAVVAFVVETSAADPVPVNVRSAPGRFDIAAIDASAGHVVAAMTEEAWRALSGPLGLPERFPSPVFLHVNHAASPTPVPFDVTVEPGGVVSVRLFGANPATVVRRAIVQGLLIRLAVAHHGVTPQLAVPLWLEHACVAWWETRAEAARLDALKQESQVLAPPPLDALLVWQRGGEEPRAFSVGALWLLTFLQSESGRLREWPAFLQRLLAGENAPAALAACYPDRFADAAEAEIWWQTGFHHTRRVRTLPLLDASESQAQLAALARFVYAAQSGDADVVVPLVAVLEWSGDAIVAADLARRRGELERLIPALHPFFRNAGLALAEAIRPGATTPARRAERCAAYERDWRDAIQLMAATNAALDALERRP